MRSCFQKGAISPVIATLLLILIAVAAGVVVYAYVVGYVGNSTTNQSNTPDNLTVDQAYLSSSVSTIPVTVYVRNLGPSPETFSSAFSISSQSMDDVLGVAIQLIASKGSFNVTSVSLSAPPASSSVTVNVVGNSCTGSGFLTVKGFGVSNSGIATCSGGTYSPEAVTLAFSYGAATSTSLAATAGAMPSMIVGTSGVVFGLVFSSGGITVPINSVMPLTLAPQGVQTSSILLSGSTYTLQINGNDGAVVDFQAKCS